MGCVVRTTAFSIKALSGEPGLLSHIFIPRRNVPFKRNARAPYTRGPGKSSNRAAAKG